MKKIPFCSNYDKTHALAFKKSNNLGLFDVIGNVSEWGWDIKRDDVNKDGYSSSLGGSWNGFRNSSKNFNRTTNKIKNTSSTLRFRLVRNHS